MPCRMGTSPRSHAQAKALGLPGLLRPAWRERTSRWPWSSPGYAAGLEAGCHRVMGRRVHRQGVRGDGLVSRGAGRAATKTTTEHQPARFIALLDHLATLTCNHLRVAGHKESGFELLATATPTQRRALEIIGAPIPMTLE